ncbi:hypothetical protein CGMCC3_g4057 [Colletotrichum fructicola]|nr:uncharacterized protein CGMCC3_g4057 [Colletotrichum fructicola]KAE9580034.1 hypothetical protein CGMCC3_g4057 [Colletotrichum fructicola]
MPAPIVASILKHVINGSTALLIRFQVGKIYVECQLGCESGPQKSPRNTKSVK